MQTPEPVIEDISAISEPDTPEPSVNDCQQATFAMSNEEPVNSARSQFFAKFAVSLLPEVSIIPNSAVMFAPGAKVETSHSFENDLTYLSKAMGNTEAASVANAHQSTEDLELDHHDPTSKLTPLYETSSEELRLKSPNQCNFDPANNSVLPHISKSQPVPELQSDRSYPSALKDAFAKLQERDSPQTRAPVNAYDSSNSFNNYLLDELSQNINKANIDVRSNKADAFTQSLSSNQPDTVSQPYHSIQSIKPQPQIGKPMSNMPPNTNQSMPSTQSHPLMHPAMQTNMPQLISQFQAALPMFNLHGNSGAAPQLLDYEQLQAMQQQRFLYEMQQQLQQSQTNASEPNIGNSCSDVMSSSKSTTPMNHVTTTNTVVRPDFLASNMSHHQMMNPAATAPFLPYQSLVFMVSHLISFILFLEWLPKSFYEPAADISTEWFSKSKFWTRRFAYDTTSIRSTIH